MSAKYFDPSRIKIAGHRKNIWLALMPWAYVAIFIMLVVLAIGVFWPVLQRNQELNRKKFTMLQQLEEIKSLNMQLQQENIALQSDPLYIESKARDLLNVARPGEIIFKFPPYPSSRSAFKE